jgi:heat shock protein HtpX
MNVLKTVFWMTLLTMLLIGVGRLVAGQTGMLIAFTLALVMNGAAYWFSDRLALAAASAKEVSPVEDPVLHRLADRLALQYGVAKPRVYRSLDPGPNAFATGRSPKYAAICVNDGLRSVLNERELLGVLAHEFGHVTNRDILISSVVAVMAGAITLIANIAQWTLWFGGDRRDRGGGSGDSVVAVIMILLAPLAATLIRLAVWRSREYHADRTGALASGDPMGLAYALRKLASNPRPLSSALANPAFAHLYIVNPLAGAELATLFSTHPSPEKRIRRLEAMGLGGLPYA